MNDVVVSILKFTDLTLFPENGREDVFYFDESTYKIYSFIGGAYTEQFTGSPFTGGVVPNPTTFQSDITLEGNILTQALLTITREQFPSAGEMVLRLDVDDADGYILFQNGSTVNGVFVPSVRGIQPTATNFALFMLAQANTDTGTNPVHVFESRANNAAIVNRPIFMWRNYTTVVMQMLANGNLGIGTTTASEKLEVNGNVKANGIRTGYVEKTANYTIVSSDYTINCTSGTFTVTLPTAVGISGRAFEITNTGSGRITLATFGSETIQGDLTQKIFKDECFVVRSTGLNWIVV